MRSNMRGAAPALFATVAVGLGGCTDGPGGLGPLDNIAAVPIVSDPVSFGGGASLNLTGSGFVYVSMPPGTVAGAASVTISNASTGTSLTMALVDGGLDPVALPGSAGDTFTFAIQGSGGGSPTQVTRVVPVGLRPSVVRTYPPARRDQPMLTIVRVVFSEPMNPATITGGSVQILLNGSPLDAQVTASADGLSATLELNEPLAPLTEYTMVIGAGIADLDGETLGEAISVTFTTGTSPDEPTPSGVLAFTGALGIHVMNADGTGQRSLTAESGFPTARNPAWSPDGGRIAFSLADGLGIYVMNADGTNLVRLSAGRDADPAWSPDGGRIAFSRAALENSGIYLMNADGTNLVRLSVGDDTDPTWSPDGSRIAYTVREPSPAVAYEVYVMNTDGTNRLKLTSGDVTGSHPAWSPDGSRIAFSLDTGAWFHVFVMNADGTNVVQLTALGGTRDPAWSRDGSMIAFTRDECGHWDYGCPIPDIWVARLADGLLYRLAPGEEPAWRP
jgi:dipeptidyl aminopeptidase/acylaminoacyl peptidase